MIPVRRRSRDCRRRMMLSSVMRKRSREAPVLPNAPGLTLIPQSKHHQTVTSTPPIPTQAHHYTFLALKYESNFYSDPPLEVSILP